MIKTNKFLLIVFLIFTLILPVSGCGNNNTPISKSDFYFDTIITITLYNASQEKLIDDCFDIAFQYENLLSNTKDQSDISRINAAAGVEFVEVDARAIEVLEKGLEYSRLSDGQFDITIGRLSELWNISALSKAIENTENIGNISFIPSEADINALLSSVNYENVIIEGNKVKLNDSNAKLDLGAIAKGFIADKMKEYLEENGVTSGIINLGGNIITIGTKADGSSYTVGIQKPFGETNDAILKLKLADKSIVTSGIYERYFRVDDMIYHHILDLDTGYPCDNDLYSVTIISDNSVDGDALSTICFLLGKDAGLELIESIDNTEAIFIDNQLLVYYSSGAEKYVVE